MEFLSGAWNWVCSVASGIWSWLTSLWDWVTERVQEKWEFLKDKSPPFLELFALKLLAKRIRARYCELCGKLSSSDRRELDNLIETIDARG